MIAAGDGWLVQSVEGLLTAVAGREHCWLHGSEIAQAQRFRDEGRRRSWVSGRVAAKRLLLSHGPISASVRLPRDIEICSRRDGQRGRPPVARFTDGSSPVALSISHTGHFVSVAVPLDPGTRVGIDVVEWDQAGLADLADLAHWLAPSERAWMASRPEISILEVWAAKEAAFKTLPEGTPFRPRRCVIADVAGDGAAWSFATGGTEACRTGRVRVWRGQAYAVAVATRGLGPASGGHTFEVCCRGCND